MGQASIQQRAVARRHGSEGLVTLQGCPCLNMKVGLTRSKWSASQQETEFTPEGLEEGMLMKAQFH